ncbi:MAG: hypothetical protein AAGF71_09035 [Pseudomonadota bacterium]
MSDSVATVAGIAHDHIPHFVTAPGETDGLLVGLIVAFAIVVLGIGVFYLHLHSVPERMAHKANHAQLQLIGILSLLGLLTHNTAFWVAALVIAVINPPDVMTPIRSIAMSLRKMANLPEDPDLTPEDPKPAHGEAKGH